LYAPAYDLLNVAIVNPEDQEELALTIAGNKKKITRKLLFEFGVELGLSKKQIERAFKGFHNLKDEAFALITTSFLSESIQEAYINLLESRYEVYLKKQGI